MIFYCWSSKFTLETTANELSIDKNTVTKWFKFCCEIATFYFCELDNNAQIGGPGTIVEIDECLLAKRKYNKGRAMEKVWVFGGIQRNSNSDIFWKLCLIEKKIL